MIRRILSLLLAALMLLSLAACGKDTAPTENSNSDTPSSSVTEEPVQDLSGISIACLATNRGQGLVMSGLNSSGHLAVIGMHDMENFLTPDYYFVHYEDGKPSAVSYCPTLPGSMTTGLYDWTVYLKEENGSFVTESAQDSDGDATDKSVTVTCFDSGAIQSVNILSNEDEFRFNEKGQLLHLRSGDSVGSYEFSDDGSSCTYTATLDGENRTFAQVYEGLSVVSSTIEGDSISMTATLQYDENGMLTGYTSQDEEDKTVATLSLLCDGRMPSYSMEQYQDGVLETSGTLTLEYDTAGRAIAMEQTAESSDGTKRHQKSTISYDDEGRLLHNATYRNGEDGALYLYSENTWAYDDLGNETGKTQAQYNTDGSLGQKHSYTYTHDALGQVLTTVYVAESAEGVYFRRESSNTYDLSGNQIQSIELEYGEDGALSEHRITLNVYDDSNRKTGMTVTRDDSNGARLGREVYSYEYNDAGKQITETMHSYNAEDVMEYGHIHHNEYDENGRFVKDWWEQLDADGNVIS